MTRTSFHRACGTIAILFGIMPLGLVVAHQSIALWFILPLNFVGWVAVGFWIVGLERLHQRIDEAFAKLGFSKCNDVLASRVDYFIGEFGRYYRAAFAYQELKLKSQGNGIESKELGISLQKIVQLAYRELNASAVELSLYDEASGLWPQAIVVGTPRSSEVQSLTLEAQNVNFDDSFISQGSSRILATKVGFAGNTFGALRVEFEQDYLPTQDDVAVLKLLAMQGALLLVDARYTDELVRMKQLGDESVRAKTGFLAHLSHEIRGPLGIILNGVELNLEGLCGDITQMQRETLSMIQDAGEHLLDLVNDVLDYAKAEAGMIVANPQTISLKPFLDDLANVIRSQAQLKGHKVVVSEIPEDLAMSCDKRHARQMMINFLTNAVKYTPANGIITIGAERLANARLRISVADTGVGIPEDQRDKVFGAFERVDDSYSLAQQGTGLGMPLTAKLADANGGSVDFESEPGKGSTFYINLPAATAVAQDESQDVVAVQKVVGNGDVILIADANTDSRMMLEKYFKNLGFTVVATKAGRQMLKAFRENKVAVALIDADLGEMSGEDVILALRGSPLTQGVPIILLSAKAFVFDIENYLRLGVDRCVTKPFSLAELSVTVRSLIDESRTRSS